MSRFPGEREIFIFEFNQTGSGAHPFSVQWEQSFLRPRKERHAFEDFHFPNLVPRLRLTGAITQLPHTPWCVQGQFCLHISCKSILNIVLTV